VKVFDDKWCHALFLRNNKYFDIGDIMFFDYLDETSQREFIYLLSNFNSVDLLQTIGALQLEPNNTHFILRFEAITEAILSQPYDHTKPKISLHQLKSILDSELLFNVKLQEDPCNNVFAESFCYYNGPNIIFPSNYEDISFISQAMLKALFMYRKPFSDNEYRNILFHLASCILSISTDIANRAGITRKTQGSDSFSSDVTIPNLHDLEILKQSITFTSERLSELIRNLNILEPIETTFEKDLYFPSDQENHRITKPIVKIGETRIITFPGALISSLMYTLIRIAQERNITLEVAERFHEAMWLIVKNSIGRLHIRNVEALELFNEELPCFSDAIVKFDNDKYMYIVLITDTLENDWGISLLNHSDEKSISKTIIKRYNDIIIYLNNQINDFDTVLPLILIQCSGVAPCFISIPTEAFAEATLLMNVSDLYYISYIENGDELTLLKFARALHKFRESTQVIPFDFLDYYYQFYNHGHSFYLSDDSLSNMITIMGGKKEIVKLFHEKFDPHCVQYHEKGKFTEVIAYSDARDKPIYSPYNSYSNQLEVIIELTDPSVWIFTKNIEFEDLKKYIVYYVLFMDAICYWIIQLYNPLDYIFKELGCTHSTIKICLEINEISSDEIRPINVEPSIFNTKVDIENSQITLTISLDLENNIFYGSDNSGERLMLREILFGFSLLLPTNSASKLSKSVIKDTIDKYAPLGMKKMIIILNTNAELEMHPINKSFIRYIQSYDENIILDRLGEYICKEVNIPKGMIIKEERCKLIEKYISTFFLKELEEIIKQLSSDELIEYLLFRHDVLRYEEARFNLTIPTRLACFEDFDNLASETRDESFKNTSALLSSMFLIEYIAAHPPSGKKHINLEIYDRIMAISRYYIEWGDIRDWIYYDLADLEIRILSSGRIGISINELNKIKKAFYKEYQKDKIIDSVVSFEKYWRDRIDLSKHKNKIDEFNGYYFDEFGYTFSDRGMVVNQLYIIALKYDNQIGRYMYNLLIKELNACLDISKDIVELIIDDMALKPNSGFCAWPNPFANPEHRPWIQNRKSSYRLRPLILRDSISYTEVLWGARHLINSQKYLIFLFSSRRFKTAKGGPLDKFFGEMGDETGKKFEGLVFDYLNSKNRYIIKKNVKKIPGLEIQLRNLGEIDILVADSASKTLTIIQCKDYVVHFSAREIATSLRRIYEGDNSVMYKLNKQVEFAKSNLIIILKWLGVDDKTNWSVDGLVSVDEENFPSYFKESLYPILSLSALKQKFNL